MVSIARRTFLAAAAASLGAVGVAACADRSGGGDAGDEVRSPSSDIERTRIPYGEDDETFADLWAPAGATGSLRVVVLIHGGFWRQQFGLDLMDGLAASAAGAGYAVWNIEYRRVGGAGGYPETFDDVAAAVDHLADLDDARLDLDRVAVVGHSAGGHLAGWVASRHVLDDDAPWADPRVRPVVAFPQAGVLDLVGCAENRVGGSACPDLVGGGPDEFPERYARTSPLALVPTGVPVIALHGDADSIVPLRQSETYVAAATDAGDPAELVVIDGADHFAMIDPDHEAWQAVLDRLPDLL